VTPAVERAMVESGIRLLKYWLEVSLMSRRGAWRAVSSPLARTRSALKMMAVVVGVEHADGGELLERQLLVLAGDDVVRGDLGHGLADLAGLGHAGGSG
jgi:hypothetical protein